MIDLVWFLILDCRAVHCSKIITVEHAVDVGYAVRTMASRSPRCSMKADSKGSLFSSISYPQQGHSTLCEGPPTLPPCTGVLFSSVSPDVSKHFMGIMASVSPRTSYTVVVSVFMI